jgi:hypothetical protein
MVIRKQLYLCTRAPSDYCISLFFININKKVLMGRMPKIKSMLIRYTMKPYNIKTSNEATDLKINILNGPKLQIADIVKRNSNMVN